MYYAFLGHMPALSLLELNSFSLHASSLAENIAVLENDPFPVAHLLGGTIKLAQQVAKVDKDNVLSTLAKLMDEGESKNQAVTDYAGLSLSRGDLHHLKEGVARSIRLVSMDTTPHEAIMLVKQNVTEYNLLRVGDHIIIARSIWFQNSLDWADRDRFRPYQDIKRGMLPPKLARLMVNLASCGREGILLDPFCGTGTVLMEAALLGHQVVGSDNDGEAVDGARTNLDWLIEQYQLSGSSYHLYTEDATHISSHVEAADYIVSEPYMGPLLDKRQNLDLAELKNTAKGLDKLYRGCLRDWSKFIKPGGRIVMIFPSFLVGNRNIPTISIDTCQSLGYNTLASVPYSKPGAAVIRNITILEK